MPDIIETFELTKRFSTAKNYRALFRLGRREDLAAVDRVNIRVKEGELFGLLGANGAGKTTLVKMLCTLILPTEGRATVAGQDIVAEAGAVKHVIGLINAEERSFFWRLSARQNLEFFAALWGLRGRRARLRIDELLALVKLSEHAERRFMDYSSGMRQKLAIARGLLTMPPVIFMDEPTRSLDPVGAHELRLFIREHLVGRLKRTVMLVTHHLEEAESICDRIAIMNRGQLLACGPVAQIKQHIAIQQRYHLVVEHLLPEAIEGLRAIPGVVQLQWSVPNNHRLELELLLADEKTTLPPVMRYVVANGGDIQHCQAQEVTLEKAFIHLVRQG